MGPVIEALGKHRDRAALDCGQPDLSDWFHWRAGQDERHNVARVIVAVDDSRATGSLGCVMGRLQIISG
jgi:hypothetical protein